VDRDVGEHGHGEGDYERGGGGQHGRGTPEEGHDNSTSLTGMGKVPDVQAGSGGPRLRTLWRSAGSGGTARTRTTGTSGRAAGGVRGGRGSRRRRTRRRSSAQSAASPRDSHQPVRKVAVRWATSMPSASASPCCPWRWAAT